MKIFELRGDGIHWWLKTVYNEGGLGLIPGSGRSAGEGNGNALQYYCLENPMDRGAWLVGYSPWGCKELDMTEQLHLLYLQRNKWMNPKKNNSKPVSYIISLLKGVKQFNSIAAQ